MFILLLTLLAIIADTNYQVRIVAYTETLSGACLHGIRMGAIDAGAAVQHQDGVGDDRQSDLWHALALDGPGL